MGNFLKRFFKHLANHGLWAFLSTLFVVVVIVAALLMYFMQQLPNVKTLNDVHLQVPLRIYSSDGELIAQYGTKRRIPVNIEQVPQPLVNAILATEDARFFEHSGVDFIGLARAAAAVVQSGRKVQGASTITMQVARNFFLTRKKTYTRKIKEILLALKIDHEFSKQKILELYLNKIYLGNRAYGVAAAAEVYYGKNLNELTLAQMAMLAGLPQAPSTDNPIRNPKAALKRRNHVLWRMYQIGFIDKAVYEQAIKAPVTASYHQPRIQLYAPYAAELIRQDLVNQYGNDAYEEGFSVYTTLNPKLQQAAEQSLQQGLLAYDHRHGYRAPTVNLGQPTPDNQTTWQATLSKIPVVANIQPAAVTQVNDQSVQALLANGQTITINWDGLKWARPEQKDHPYPGPSPKKASDIVQIGDEISVTQDQNQQWQLTQIPAVQGAVVSVNPNNGRVLALTGGFSFEFSHFDRATQAIRQAGSSFKPFIYSAALAKGYTLASVINDAPIVLPDSGENELWRPDNDTMQFYGPTRLRVALSESRNLVSIRLLRDIGVRYALDYLRRFGFNPLDFPATLSLALGTGGVTPWQMAGGYSVFANGGYEVKPYLVQKIIGQHGKVIYQMITPQACAACITQPNLPDSEKPNPMAPRSITPQNAYLMTQALRDVIQHGTGRAALVLRRGDLAGKTGTTNKQVDAWFSGFNSNVVTTVWVGFDDSASLYEYGAQAALPIWINYMRQALDGMPEATMPEPPGIITVRIDPYSGLRADPNQNNGIFEVFRKQYAPKKKAAGNAEDGSANDLYGNVSTASAPTHAGNDQVGDDEADQPLF